MAVILLQGIYCVCYVFDRDVLFGLHTLLCVWIALKAANPSRNMWENTYGNIIKHLLTEFIYFLIICVILQYTVKLNISVLLIGISWVVSRHVMLALCCGKVECFLQKSSACKYSETCLSWPPTVPETMVNISKWSIYTNVSQNNFHTLILFPANYLLMHIEIAQHINGNIYGQKNINLFT
jgi:hypothetical protein